MRYIMQGSVRRASGQVRINAQVIDALAGETVWAERFDGTVDDVFAPQDAVTRRIVSALAGELTSGEEAELSREETDIPAAHDAFLKGWEHYLRQTPSDLKQAIEAFETTVALDPDYGRAHEAIAAACWQIAQRWWHAAFDFPNAHPVRAHAAALLVKALQWETPIARQLAAAIMSRQGRHTEALAEGARALALDPNEADSYAALAGALSLAGDADQALTMIRKVIRLNPRSPRIYHYQFGLAAFGLGNFSRARNAFEEAIRLNPEDRWSMRLLVATYGHPGRREEAMRIVEENWNSWYGTGPITVRAVSYWYPYRTSGDRERLITGLELAGVSR